MDNTLKIKLEKAIPTILFDILAIIFVYLIPSIAHLTGIPFYLAEPMRIVLILALVHTGKRNAYIVAATLPLVSFAISSHPYFLKSIIISIELLLNVWLFFTFFKKSSKVFISIISSILISKAIYYLLKYILIITIYPDNSLISTPIWIQLIVMGILSGYVYLFLHKRIQKSS